MLDAATRTGAVADPLAGLPEAGAERGLTGSTGSMGSGSTGSMGSGSMGSMEIRGSARVLQVAQLLFGELHDLRHLEEPRWRRCLAYELAGAAIAAAGVWIACAWIHRFALRWAGLLLLLAGVGMLVLTRLLWSPPRVSLGGGRSWLVRWRRGRFELNLPRGAEGEQVVASRTHPLSGPRVVPLSPDGSALVHLGELEVRLEWVYPTRGLPADARPLRRPRWGLGIALAVSALAQGLALAAVFAIPPAPWHLFPRDDEERVLIKIERRPTEGPEEPFRDGLRRASFTPALPGNPSETDEPVCSGKPPEPELHLGHLTISGPREPRALRRSLEWKLRTLAACYRVALLRCVGHGRMVLLLEISREGITNVESTSSSFAAEVPVDGLGTCVTSATGDWKFPPTRVSSPTRVRVPFIFRYVGATRFHPDPGG